MNTRLEASIHVIEAERRPCPRCEGRGWVVVRLWELDGRDYDVSRDCRHCGGSGWLWRDGTPATAPKESRLKASEEPPSGARSGTRPL